MNINEFVLANGLSEAGLLEKRREEDGFCAKTFG